MVVHDTWNYILDKWQIINDKENGDYHGKGTDGDEDKDNYVD